MAEYSVAARIADLIAVPQSDAVFVLDDKRNRLLRVSLQADGISRDVVAEVPSSAVKLSVSASWQ